MAEFKLPPIVPAGGSDASTGALKSERRFPTPLMDASSSAWDARTTSVMFGPGTADGSSAGLHGNRTTLVPEDATLNPLMRSLGAARKSFKKHGLRDSTQIMAVDGSVIPPSKLPLLRVSDGAEMSRATAEEADAVRALSHAVAETGVSSTGLENVKRMQERRKVRHDDAIRQFEAFQRKYYSEAEDRVLALGRELRAGMADIDLRLRTVIAKTNDPELALSADVPWLDKQLQAAEALEEERRQCVHRFADALEAIESERAAAVGDRLQQLAALLIDIGHELSPAVERLVDAYAAELNLVLIANRKEHAQVAAQLELSGVAARASMLSQWQIAERQWRTTRHENAVAAFISAMDSEAYTNPPARARELSELGAAASQRHSRERLPMLRELASLRPPRLTTAEVDVFRNRLRGLEEQDAADSAMRVQGVRRAHDAAMEDARGKLEALRRELHAYEALCPGGHLDSIGAGLAQVLASEEWAEFFRRAGGLRSELEGIAGAAQASDVVYDAPLSALHARVELLVACMDVGPAMEAVGKSTERSAFISALDALRTAKRTDIPGLLVKLHRLGSSMLRVPGIPAVVISELEAVTDALADTIEEVHEAMIGAGVEPPQPLLRFLFPEKFPSGGSTLGGGSVIGGGASVVGGGTRIGAGSVATPAARTSGGSVAGKSIAASRAGRVKQVTTPAKNSALPTTPGRRSPHTSGSADRSESGGRARSAGSAGTRSGSEAGASAAPSRTRKESASRRSGGGRRSVVRSSSNRSSILSEMTDPTSHVLGQVLPLAAIRALQRRLGVVVSASDLPPAAQALLKKLQTGCAAQQTANSAVNSVLAARCSGPIEARVLEGVHLVQRVNGWFAAQQRAFYSAEDRICTLFAEAAHVMEEHLAHQKAADDWAQEELAGALDDFESTHARLEKQFEETREAICQAPDLHELERRSHDAVLCLASIESTYRQHHSKSCKLARQHPARVASVLRAARAALTAVFALRFPDAARLDGGPLPGESLASMLPWTVDGPVLPAPPPPSATESAAEGKLDSPPSSRPSSGASSRRGSSSPRPARARDASPQDEGVLPVPKALAVVRIPDDAVQALEPHKDADSVDASRPPPGFTLERLAQQIAALRSLGSARLQDRAVLMLETSAENTQQYEELIPGETVAAFLADPQGTLTTLFQEQQGLEEAARTARAQAEAEAEAAAAALAAANSKEKKGGSKGPASTSTAKSKPAAQPRGSKSTGDDAASRASGGDSRPATSEAARRSGGSEGIGVLEPQFSARSELTAVSSSMVAEVASLSADEAAALGLQPRVLASDVLGVFVTSLRNDLLRHFQLYVVERRHMLHDVMDARVAALTAELEERLRCHWPRKGELEVSFCAPRREQLVDHRKRLDRFLRRTREKDASEAESIHALLQQAQAALASALAQVADMTAALPDQDTPAALQGVQARCRQLRAATFTDNAKRVQVLRTKIPEETAKLVHSTAEFLASCTPLDAGGSYATSEVDGYRAVLEELGTTLRAAGESRLATLDMLGADVQTVTAAFDRFDVEYERAMKQLSLRQGLGTQYGAPRRAAQERIRTAYAWSDDAANAIDARIRELRALLTEDRPGAVPCTQPAGTTELEEQLAIIRASRGLHDVDAGAPQSSADSITPAANGKDAKGDHAKGAAKAKSAAGKEKATKSTDAVPPAEDAAAIARSVAAAASNLQEDEAQFRKQGPAPLSVRIRRCVCALRDALFERAAHLGALKQEADVLGAPRRFNLPFLSLSDALQGAAAAGTVVLLPASYGSVTDAAALLWPPLDGSEVTPAALAPRHTVRGATPNSRLTEALARQPLQRVVADALDACRAATIAMFATEGVTITTEDQLPASMRDFMNNEVRRLDEFRESSMRRLREQVDTVQDLLADAPDILVQDVITRERAKLELDATRRAKVFAAQMQAFEAVRAAHVDKLRISLADPNSLAALQGVIENEDRRVADVERTTQEARKAACAARAELYASAVAHVAHSCALFALTAEEVLTRADLIALPGDELIVPKKMSFKRLHKSMRKSGADAAAALAAAALGDVDGVEIDDAGQVVLAGAEAGHDAVAAATARSAAPGVAAAASSRSDVSTARGATTAAAKVAAAKTPASAAKPTQATESATLVPAPPLRALKGAVSATRTWAGVDACELQPSVYDVDGVTPPPLALATVGTFCSSYTTVSRHCVRARDAAVGDMKSAFVADMRALRSRFDDELRRVGEWKELWGAKSNALRAAATGAASSVRPGAEPHPPSTESSAPVPAPAPASPSRSSSAKPGGAKKQ